MYSYSGYDCFSLPELFDKYDVNIIQNILNQYKCNKNEDIQSFLINNSIIFTKKHQAITYLIFDKSGILQGYFALSIKSINIGVENFSKSALGKVLRLSDIDDERNTVNPAAYLIAQLGKNDNSKIDINIMFEMISYYINKFQNGCGGVVEFLEAENASKLIALYENCGFKKFNIRNSKTEEDRKLVQMYRLI